jgi:hypothetical protein
MGASQYRYALAGSYNTRVSATNVLSSSSGIVGVGIVGIMIVGLAGTTTTKDQRFVNVFSEKVLNPYTGKITIYTVKRPGFAPSMTVSAGQIGTAILIWTGSASKIISAFGTINSTLYNSTTSLGAITGKSTGITETFVGANVATIVSSSSDSTAWYYDVPTAIATKITDVDFPGNAGETIVGTFAHMDGYAFIMDAKGRIWNSDLNSVTSWTAASFVSANSYPDAGVAVVRSGNKLLAMGTESVQFYYVNPNGTGVLSPLSRIETMTLKVGCVSADAITQLDNAIYWAGSSAQSGFSVYQYENSVKRISTPEIEAILIIAGAGSTSLSSLKFYGRSFVIVTAGSITFVYCVEEQAWHEWNSTAPLWYKCAGISSGSAQVSYSVSNLSTSGKVYTLNPTSYVFQDDGTAYTALIQTSQFGEGNRKTRWDYVQLTCDTQPTTSLLSVSVSDDDYATFKTLGTVDLAKPLPRVNRCGAAYRRAWSFSHSANTAMRVEAMTGTRSS